MRAVRYHSHGGPEVLLVEEVPVPTPGEGEVLVEVEAIGANVIDTVFRAGTGPWSRPLPGKITGDVVGRVVALGPGVSHPAVGARVTGLSEDAAADQVTLDVRWVTPVPETAEAAEATVLAMTAPLALRLLRSGQVTSADTVLVQAAAGGIGHLLVQLAKSLGAKTVIGTASSAAKRDFARALGADVVVDSTDGTWPDQVRAAAPGGVTVVLDAIGGETFDRGLDLLEPLGRMVTYGAVGGELPVVSVMGAHALKYVTGVSVTAWRAARPAEALAEQREAARLWEAGRLKSVVHASFPLDAIADAHTVLDRRENLGRVVLIP